MSKKKREPAPKPPAGGFPGGKVVPEPGELRIAVDKVPYAEIIGHALIEPDVEVCGVLVGSVGEDEHGKFVHVRAAIRGQAARQAGAAVTFTHETWNHIHQEMDRRDPADQIVGWYHTHGGFGVFLSEDDTFIHQNFFTEPHHLAYVYDPLAGSEGFFVRQAEGEDAGKLVPVRRYWMGGRERKPAMRMPESEARPARPAVEAGAGAGGAGTGGAALDEVATELKKMSVALQWSARERAEEPGWASWGPWIVAAVALGLCLLLVQQRREGEPRTRAAVVVVTPDGRLESVPLATIGPGADGIYAVDVELPGKTLELRTEDGAVVGRLPGLATIRQAIAAEEQRRAAEEKRAELERGSLRRYLLWAAAIAAAVAALASTAWWFFLRRR